MIPTSRTISAKICILGMLMVVTTTPTNSKAATTEFDDDVTIGFEWTAPTGVIDHYKIYVSEEDGPYAFVTTVATTSYDLAAENDKSYSIKVSAVNPDGVEGPKSEGSNPVICDIVPPTDPTISPNYQILDQNTAKISIAVPSSDNHLDGYQVNGGAYSQWTDTVEVTEFTFGLLLGQHNTLRIRAIDLAGHVSSNDAITVNRSPRLSSVGDKTVDENALLSFAVSATDSDGDQLTLSSSNLPAGASFAPATGSFSWTPDYTQAGQYQITFSVADGYGGSDSEQITVTVADLNRPPVLDPIDDITVQAGQTVRITANATDPDDDPVTITYSGWMNSDTKTTTIDDVGTHTVTITASDGNLSDSRQITVTVAHEIPGAPGKPVHVD